MFRKAAFDGSNGNQKSDGDQEGTQKPARRRLVKRKVKAKSERIACTSCGSPIDIKNVDQAEMVTCKACGSVLDLESDDHKILSKILADQRPRPHLPLGSKGRLKGKEWEVIGWQRMREGSDRWDEFLLFNPTAGYAWLQLENGHWILMKKSKQKAPIDAKKARPQQSFRLFGKKFTVVETSQAQIDHIEGEFTYQAQKGDKVGYLDAVAPPDIVCAEWTERELEWMVGQYISPDIIKKAFELPAMPTPRGAHKCQPFNIPPWRKHLAWTLAAFAAALFVLIFVSLIPGSRTNQFTVRADEYLKQKNPKGFVSEPLVVKDNTVMQVKCHAPVDNSWIYLEALLLDEQKQPVVSFTQELSYYHGYSGGESWSEGSRSDSQSFRIDKPGAYRLALRGDGGKGNYGNTPRRETVTVSVYQGVMLQRYFIIATILALLLPLFELVRYGSFQGQKHADD